jgi:methionyl-tRNA synthetase
MSYNADLANNLGNLFSRTTSMVLRYFDGTLVGSCGVARDEILGDEELSGIVQSVASDIEACRYSVVLETIWRQVLDPGNRYIEQRKPWLLANEKKPEYDLDACLTVLTNLAEIVRIAAVLIRPFMPRSAATMYAGFNFPVALDAASFASIAPRAPLAADLRVTAPLGEAGKIEPLFPKIDAG